MSVSAGLAASRRLVRRHLAAVVAVVAIGSVTMAACASDQPGSAVSSVAETTETVQPLPAVAVDDLDGLGGELVLTRQRDLIDRGLVNVLTHNDTGEQIVIHDRSLVASHFDTPSAERRTTGVGAGRRIALQVPYGLAVDCADDTPVTAVLEFTYTTATDPELRPGRMPVGGTDLLDAIRAEQCTTSAFEAATTASLDDVSIVDGTVTANLVITRTDDGPTIEIGNPSGTILMSVRVDESYDGSSLVDPGERVVIPIAFVVNRCDPHALAEITKRYGLDLSVSVGDAPPQPVAIDVTALVPEFEDAVQRCFDAQG